MSFCKGFTQGGSNADVVIADAFIKDLREGIDWNTAYEAVISDAEGEPEPLFIPLPSRSTSGGILTSFSRTTQLGSRRARQPGELALSRLHPLE
jgi:hypothetical protein